MRITLFELFQFGFIPPNDNICWSLYAKSIVQISSPHNMPPHTYMAEAWLSEISTTSSWDYPQFSGRVRSRKDPLIGLKRCFYMLVSNSLPIARADACLSFGFFGAIAIICHRHSRTHAPNTGMFSAKPRGTPGKSSLYSDVMTWHWDADEEGGIRSKTPTPARLLSQENVGRRW